jgi:hypothetical protein
MTAGKSRKALNISPLPQRGVNTCEKHFLKQLYINNPATQWPKNPTGVKTMKIILDDTNPADAQSMQILGIVMARPDIRSQLLGMAKPAAPPTPAAQKSTAEAPVDSESKKPAIAAVSNPEPETPEENEQGEAPEVDADGVEWDPELHASTKTKTQDGRWKKRRGATPKPQIADRAAPAQTKTGPAPDFEAFKKAIVSHKGKFGVDRTKAVLMDTAGVDQPSVVPEEKRAAVIEALENDKQIDIETVDLDDFC